MAGTIRKLGVLTGFKGKFRATTAFCPATAGAVSRVNNGSCQESVFRRNLATTQTCRLKEISMNEVDNKIVIEGKHVASPRLSSLAKLPENKGSCQECPLCRLGLTVRHTDVLIINQFVNTKGKQLPREVTGLCRDQHKRMDYLIVMAEKAGLLDREVERTVVHNGNVLYTPEEWEDPHFRKFYDESVIEEFLYSRRKRHI